jgi:hypothetical protein
MRSSDGATLAAIGPTKNPSGARVKREAEGIGAERNGDNAGQDAICVWHGLTAHFADRRASSSRSMQKSEEHL